MNSQQTQSVHCLMGATATGKTDMACWLADRFDFELVSVDSALVYKDMNIGTAKPSREQLKCYPHALVDICVPTHAYSVGQFCDDARQVIQGIIDRGKRPLLVGGTMNYFHRLQQGFSELPSANPIIRQALDEEAAQVGWPAMHDKLKTVDPITAERLHPNDAQRIQRAMEVFEQTGIPLSTLHQQRIDRSDYRFVNMALWPNDRAQLHHRIALRFDLMIQQGLVEEVRELMNRYPLDASLPSMRCVGYRQALSYIQGEVNADTFRHSGIAATRQLAKRQLTWLRRWDQVTCFEIESSTHKDQMLSFVAQSL